MATLNSDINDDFIDGLPMGAFFHVTVTHERMLQGPEALKGFLSAHNAKVNSVDVEQPTMDVSSFNYTQTVAAGPKKIHIGAVNIGSVNPGTFYNAAQSEGTILSQPQQPKVIKEKEKLTDKEIIERYNEIMEKRQKKQAQEDNEYAHLEV